MYITVYYNTVNLALQIKIYLCTPVGLSSSKRFCFVMKQAVEISQHN